MPISLKEDIKPISLFRTDPGSILRQVKEKQRPIVITDRGKPAAVVLGVEEYERQQEKLELMEAIVEGEEDLRAGRAKSLSQVQRETRRWLPKK